MPELPEVETVVRDLRREGLVGRCIRDARVDWARTIAAPSLENFLARIRGQRVEAVTRRAKYIVLTLSRPDVLLVHLRMTGGLEFAAADAPPGPHQRVSLSLDDGRELRFRDPRKFGRWHLLNEAGALLGALGPEPLEAAFTPAILAGQLAGRSRPLKPLLLDQHVVAGLGNIYVDEALWEARLHPRRRGDTLRSAEIARLHAAIRCVLTRGIAAGGTTLGRGQANFYSVAGHRGRHQDGLQVFRRTGEPCPRCAGPITRLVVEQRSTHLCVRCQPPPRRADPGDYSRAVRRRPTRVRGSASRSARVTQATVV